METNRWRGKGDGRDRQRGTGLCERGESERQVDLDGNMMYVEKKADGQNGVNERKKEEGTVLRKKGSKRVPKGFQKGSKRVPKGLQKGSSAVPVGEHFLAPGKTLLILR
jgi:hypothetical protein